MIELFMKSLLFLLFRINLDAEHVLLVNQFAENLRDGKVELPVTDKTKELRVKVEKRKN